MVCGREQRLDIWTEGAANNGTYFNENITVNVLQWVCSLAVNRVVREFAGVVTGAVPSLLVNVFEQLQPVSRETSHSLGIAHFPSICWKVLFPKLFSFSETKFAESIWYVMVRGDAPEVKWMGKLANAVGSQYPSHYLGTWCIQQYYRWCAHLDCAAVDWTDDLNGLVLFARKTKFGFCACAITFQVQSTLL